MNNDLISREALKKYARVVFDKDLGRLRVVDVSDINNAPTVTIPNYDERPHGEWIPISERLPNRNGCYIVTRIIEETAISDVCYFDGQNTWHSDNRVNHGRPYLTDITAWQSLPEPYKKGGAE